jgi:uncharacterized membrane protein YdjX (TVP38/TMEM64 family)
VVVRVLPVGQALLDVIAWGRGAGALGVAAFGLAYALAVVAFVPGSVLTLGAGFVWGPLGGLAIVWPASVVGATGAFLLGRTLLRSRVESWVAGDARFAAVDRALGDRGFLVVILLRLSPLFPFVLLNYALGLTRVRIGTYVLASFLGMLPGTLLFTYLGSTLGSLAEVLAGAPSGGATRAAWWVGLGVTLVATAVITRIATRALSDALREEAR